MRETPTVFIIQQPRPKADGWLPNFQPATQHGKIRFIFDSAERAYADPARAIQILSRELEHFDPRRDYLLAGTFGDPACLWLAIMFLTVAKGCRELCFLYWSRGRSETGLMSNDHGFYFPVKLSFDGLSTSTVG